MKSMFIPLVCSLMIWCTCGPSKIHTDKIERGPVDCNQPPYDKIPDAEEFTPLQVLTEMIYEEVPDYPSWAEQAGIEGTVKIRTLILKDGRVDSAFVEMSSGSKVLDDAALKAAYKNRFKPGIRDGCPVAAWVTYEVSFSVNN